MDLRREIEQEQHLEVLRRFTLLAFSTIDKLQADNDRLRQKWEEEARQLQGHLDLEIQLTALRKILFGKSSEKRTKNAERDADQLLLHAQSLAPSPRAEEAKDLATEEIIHELNVENLQTLAGAKALGPTALADWEAIAGFYETHQEITVIERKYTKVLHKRQKYRHKDDASLLLTAPGPEKILPGCTYSLDFALAVVTDKYAWHLPLERQRKRMHEQGLEVSVKTLYGLCLFTATHLEKVKEGIRKDIFSASLAVGIDETTWPILDPKADDGYLWSLSNQAGSFYQFEPTRSGQIAEEMLQGYQGPVVNDGFSGYNRLKKIPGILVGNCWSHARRKFFEIQDYYPKETKEILDLIDLLFTKEREAKSWEQLGEIRTQESKKITDDIHAWLVKTKTLHPRESALQKAIDYTLHHWQGLTAFLQDPRLPLSNNDTERALRHGVMGRKNHYGSKTINGADTAATLYTIIESCKKVQISPQDYMRYVIKQNNRKQEALTPLAYARQIRGP
jgi:transposase